MSSGRCVLLLFSMRRFIGALLILIAPILWLPALFMENTLGITIFFGAPILLLTGIFFMWSQRPSAQEVMERMERKDLLGSIVVLGALVLLVGACVIAARFIF